MTLRAPVGANKSNHTNKQTVSNNNTVFNLAAAADVSNLFPAFHFLCIQDHSGKQTISYFPQIWGKFWPSRPMYLWTKHIQKYHKEMKNWNSGWRKFANRNQKFDWQKRREADAQRPGHSLVWGAWLSNQQLPSQWPASCRVCLAWAPPRGLSYWVILYLKLWLITQKFHVSPYVCP